MSMAGTTSLLLEVGCEELPARFLEAAERDLGVGLGAALGLLRPPNGDGRVSTYSTPRRLVAHIPSLYAEVPGTVDEIIGPPVKVAFDKEGKPTRAAESFAAKNNAKVSDLKRVSNAKGEYLALVLPKAGRSALEVLVEALPVVVGGLSFPKSMYWTVKAGPRFARPIRWILALLGEGSEARVVPFEFAGVESGQFTFGHRLAGHEPIRVNNFKCYLNDLRDHLVEANPEVRRKRIREELKVLLAELKLRVVPDDFLESWVVNSTEWPEPLLGSFNPRYLALPREVLIIVMRDHQKYFAAEDEVGSLQPNFVTFLNVVGDPQGVIRQGHERVLAARFADAEFFWQADQKLTLEQRIPMLERVTYQAKLGSYADKVGRMKVLAEKICLELEQTRRMTSEQRQNVLRAIELCKCDLTAQMVREFTDLQGIIGGLYAKVQGESSEVSEAIYDHYSPVSMEDSCPRSVIGAVVSLADKLDSVVSGFSAGIEPTGSSDPFGLRRAGNGIVKIAAERLPGLALDLLPAYASGYSIPVAEQSGLGERVRNFLRERVGYYLREVAKLRYDTTRAVVGSALGWSDPSDAALRGRALEQMIHTDDYRAMSQAAKRTRNILIKSAGDYIAGIQNVRVDLLREPEEEKLHEAFTSMGTRLLDLEKQRDYVVAFRELRAMREPIDSFFDHVLVMTDQPDIRANRLALLNSINAQIFSRLADLSEVESEDPNGDELGARDGAARLKR